MVNKRKRGSSNSHSISLPIHAVKETLLDAIADNQVVIVTGQTGSGKTTQIPQFLHKAGYGSMCITQPRRVACITISSRVALEMGVELGQLVGYQIRFEDKTTKNTKLKFMTDGMLLRELLTDKHLKKYEVIILDEVHERTLRTDVLFGAIKQILKQRKKLKLIIMSATMDASKFSDYFNRYINFKF
jgi:HrpA-like RNA helicase